MPFVGLAQVRLLRSSMAVLYHVNGKLQRAYSWFLIRRCLDVIIDAFSHDVKEAILVFQNNETAAMLVYQDNPVEIELFRYVKTFFCSNELA